MNITLIAALKASTLTHSADASKAIENGRLFSSTGESHLIADLERIHSKRYNELLLRPGKHPVLLASGIDEMLTNLRGNLNDMAHCVSIDRGDQDPGYLVFVRTSDYAILGCVRMLENWKQY